MDDTQLRNGSDQSDPRAAVTQWQDSDRCGIGERTGGEQRFQDMTAAKVRLAMAAMGQKETKVTDLCSELAITRQTLYRHVAPDGTLRKDGLKVVEGGKIRSVRKNDCCDPA